MAGLGRKVFTASEVLTAANVNGYLMDQTVMKYANTSAVSSAVGTALADGMQFFLTDTDETVWHNGTSFQKEATTTNAIINGAFDIWQRGTTFSATNLFQYTADRWFANCFTGVTATVSQQTFTPGTAPVAGYESAFYLNWTGAASPTSDSYLYQRVEDVRTLANQTVTLSFWAKSSTSETVNIYADQNFGSGGSSTVSTTFAAAQVLTTSWVRYSYTATLGSMSGKTIGTSSFLAPTIKVAQAGGAFNIDMWGVQLEAGSVATPFRRNAPSLQGELAACQRYYYRETMSASSNYGLGAFVTTSLFDFGFRMPITMRTGATAIDYSGLITYDATNGSSYTTGTWTLVTASGSNAAVRYTHPSSAFTVGRVGYFYSSTSGYVGFSAEL